MRRYGKAAVAATVLSLGLAAGTALAQDDGYIRGYVSAVAEREYGVQPAAVDVQNGVVQINAPKLTPDQQTRLADTLRRVPGVTDIRLTASDGSSASPPVGEIVLPPATTVGVAQGRSAVVAAPATSPTPSASATAAAPVATADEGVYVPAVDERFKLGLLPGRTLFDPLIADPRWPHVAGTYRAYQGNNRFSDGGAADFGGSLSIYRFDGPGDNGLSEIGLQAGVFSLFDLDAESHDLINADYFVALNYSYRVDKLSFIARVLHQSSHVGDEFLINNPTFDRVNFSYEQINLLASYDLTRSWRFYGGGGWLFDQDPNDLDRWSIHYGVEYKAPFTIAKHIRPVAGADFQQKEYEDWNLDLMVRAGVQFEGSEGPYGNRLLLLLEYYTGRDPDGQFYVDSVQWWGIGLHWFF